MSVDLSPRLRTNMLLDIVAPDGVTTLLPAGLKLGLHVPPQSIQIKYSRNRQTIQTRGGFVVQHWGAEPTKLTVEAVTGGFIRLYTGLTSTTGGEGAVSLRGSRRDTLAYDSYLDVLALFHSNGSVYGADGRVVLQGKILVNFENQKFYGWFDDLNISEDANRPFLLTMSFNLTIQHESMPMRAPQ